jgi:plasmid maintenance system killer protein
MWRVLESKAARKVLDGAPEEVQRKWAVWMTIVEQSGPAGLRPIKGFHDEALSGEWQGHRSSRLNVRYRILYRVARDWFEVHVVDVTRHDYRKR